MFIITKSEIMKHYFFIRLLACSILASSLSLGVKPVILSGPATPIGPAYSIEKIREILSSPALPTGIHLIDKQQTFANIANAMDTHGNAQENSHSGYTVDLYEPSAWLGKRRAIAAKEYKTFGAEDTEELDRLPALHIQVSPDTPYYITGAGIRSSRSVEHVVLRSIDKLVVVQPASIDQTTRQVQNAFGAKVLYTGAMCLFSLEDVEKVRSASPQREFFVTVVGQGRGRDRDFRVKPKHFEMLGD